MIKYIQVYRSLRRDITGHHYKPDDKLPPVLKLMAQFKASCCTVQHALNMLEKEGLIQGVPSQGLFVRNSEESALYGSRTRKKEMKRVGVLLNRPSLTVISGTPYIRDMVNSIGEILYRAGRHGYAIDVLNKSNHEVIREINGLALDGLICVEMEDKKLVRAIKQMKLPMVHCELVDARSNDLMVLADHFHGGELTAQKLAQLGHKRVLFIHGHKKKEQATDPTNVLRWQGIQQSANKAGISAHQAFIPMDSGKSAVIDGLIQKALQEHADCTGIISNSYIINTARKGLVAWAAGKGPAMDLVVFDVPDSPLIIGNKPAWFCYWDAREMGKLAAQILLGTAKSGPRMRFLPMQISKG
ncbi:MAG: hypothetical protein A2248_10335 [Candidatus Raymondbacteria bacterium RIFOXYA2_FULL_49_16]|nr:MAG: hypothetical protein A2248_10335 [Candidatus Raymondbacteria bacterium RIFOXYA2_FULL_49_16]OGJ99326.1 MAG: hypothetical protein A2453_13390 [Candidatus Raymondbacteria bacterium RIFOXYC2_FULL_50_21]OGP39817.1 MAG: hypothetical protein A2324_10425 [Candidatus Raymondbacteria bacterium RIFOXYB2_FULL_49_35]